MADSNFIDYVKILARSGRGGAGSRHFYRAKYVPKGGPDGGDGGRGGHVTLRGNRHMWTLLPLKYRRHVFAGNGQAGGAGRSFGKDGEDVVVEVPCGTVVYDADTGELVAQVTADGQEVRLLKGGRGGLGNWHFKSPTNQTPRYAQPGEPAQERSVVLELKLLADVGLVGFPNAGKSTLLAALSAARPKIADYPFTTMEPQLGIVPYRDNRSFVMADIPGIIEGAAEGRGLGLRFLRHIERNAVLLFMVPADAADIRAQYQVLAQELERFNPQLADKPRVLAVSKCDLLDQELMDELRRDAAQHLPQGVETVFISAATGMGLAELKDTLWRAITDESNQLAASEAALRPLDLSHRVAEEDSLDIRVDDDPDAGAYDDDGAAAEGAEGRDLRAISPQAWDARAQDEEEEEDEEPHYALSDPTEEDPHGEDSLQDGGQPSAGDKGNGEDKDQEQADGQDKDPDIIGPDDPEAFLYESSL